MSEQENAVAAVDAVEQSPTEGQQTQETAPTGVDGEGAQSTEEPKRVPVSEIKKERERRRRAQEEAAYYKGLYEGRAQQEPAQSQESPETWEKEYYSNPRGTIDRAVQTALLNERKERVRVSELEARRRHDDYDEVVSSFARAAQLDPSLVARMVLMPDPGEYAYAWAKQNAQTAQQESPAEIEARIRAKIEAEMKKRGAVAAAEQTTRTQAGLGGVGAQPAGAGKPQGLGALFDAKANKVGF